IAAFEIRFEIGGGSTYQDFIQRRTCPGKGDRAKIRFATHLDNHFIVAQIFYMNFLRRKFGYFFENTLLVCNGDFMTWLDNDYRSYERLVIRNIDNFTTDLILRK